MISFIRCWECQPICWAKLLLNGLKRLTLDCRCAMAEPCLAHCGYDQSKLYPFLITFVYFKHTARNRSDVVEIVNQGRVVLSPNATSMAPALFRCMKQNINKICKTCFLRTYIIIAKVDELIN